MRNRWPVVAFVAAIALTAPALAQTQTSNPPSGSFQSLSPGDQKIARALFEAQQPTAKGPAPLSLNQIADRKGSTGWGEVFKQMQTEGLVNAKNLGQVVSSSEHANVHTGDGARGVTPVGVTTGNGHAIGEGSGHSASSESDAKTHGEAHEASNTTTVTTAGGSSVGAAGAVHGGGMSQGGGGGSGAAHGH